jgi:hypothetical protein
MRFAWIFLAILLPPTASAAVLASRQPVAGGGVTRWSQLWQDPGPNGNDLDGDSVCWSDFTLTSAALIDHLEWWGFGACELGFQIEFWRQDPGTIAYQPLGVFYYGGVHTVQPEPPGFIRVVPSTAAEGTLTHYSADLPSPVSLLANDSANPRWFVAIIGLTHQPYVTWNWAQTLVPGSHTYQFVRGDGHDFRALGDARALVIATPPDPADFNRDGNVDGQDFLAWQVDLGAAGPGLACDANRDERVDRLDFAVWAEHFTSAPAPTSAGAAAPEPAGAWLAAIAVITGAARRREIAHQKCRIRRAVVTTWPVAPRARSAAARAF